MMDVLIGQLFKGIKPAVLTWYRDRTGIAQKMHRLEMLVTKVRSVIEVYENVEIKNEHLHKLQQLFKEAATQGDEVLRKLQNQVDNSSSSSGVSNFFERMISRNENVQELSRTLERMEDVSANVKDFLKTLKLELSELVEQRSGVKLNLLCALGESCSFTTSKRQRRQNTLPTEIIDFNTNSELCIQKRAPFDPSMSIKDHEKMPIPDVNISQLCTVDLAEQYFSMENDDVGLVVVADQVKLEVAPNSLMEKELQSTNLPKFLSEQIDQVAAADGLVAELQDAVDKVEQQGGDDSLFSQWITNLREAIEEGNCIVSAIKSNNYCMKNNYCMNDQILDEVGVVLTAVCQKLEGMRNDLDDFSDLVKAEKLARELHSKQKLILL